MKNIKMIEVNDENFTWIASKIKKFFHHRDVVYWHNFDCGSRKHIPADFTLQWSRKGEKVRPVFLHMNARCKKIDKDFISINLTEGYGALICKGDFVGFAGNRLHVKLKSIISGHQWLYDVYQIWDPNGGFADLQPTRPDLDRHTVAGDGMKVKTHEPVWKFKLKP